MTEEFVFRRRNRLKRHFVNTSNVLLYGYQNLSDAAKITYQVIDSFDWEDGETGTSKGYTFPSLKTIAKARGKSWTTIWRHIEELVEAGLISKRSRAKEGKPSILIIEDVSPKEQQEYLAEFVDRKASQAGVLQNCNGGVLQNCKANKEESFKENENDVNDNKTALEEVKQDPISINQVLQKRTAWGGGEAGKDRAKREYLAGEMIKVLGDEESLGCYRKIAQSCPEHLIFQALSLVKDTARAGKIRVSKGALFVDLVKRLSRGKGIELGLTFTGSKRAANLASLSGAQAG
jgi:DNA-binding MarR family transcriptional regulator